jgi:hypothetical protein
VHRDSAFTRVTALFALHRVRGTLVMPAHSRSQNGVAELVIGPATSGGTRWLAYA